MSIIVARQRHSLGAALTLAALALAVAAFGSAPRTAAQTALTLEVTAAFEGNYAPDSWLPLSIVLRNGGPPTRVTVAAAPPLAEARNTAIVDVPGGGEAAFTLFVAMDRASRELVVTVEDEGAVLAEQRVAVRAREGERLLALVGAPPPELRLPRRQELAALPFLPFPIAPSDLPEQPVGLASLALLLLGDVPAESLNPAQLTSLHAWVRAGGHLVIAGGPGAGTTLAALPAELRVAPPGGPAALDPTPLAAFAEAGPPPALPGLALMPAADALVVGSATPLWAQRTVGAGLVTQLAFDPAALENWEGAQTLWDQLLRPANRYTTLGLDFNPDPRQAQVLSLALANLPPTNLPNATPLFALLALYAVLIGPGLALVLRRLDRQALGWVVLPAIALGFTAIATGIAVASRADQRIATQVTLVEQVDGATARARAAFGLLTPREEAYTVAVGGNAVVRPLRAGVATFGPINSAAGDLAQEGADLSLTIDPWELQGVQAEALVPLPLLDAELRLGAGEIMATVRNTTGRALRDVSVVYAGQAVRLGDLEPGASASAPWPGPLPAGVAPGLATAPLSIVVLGEELRAGRAPGSAPERQVLIQEALLTVVTATGPQGEGLEPLALGWLTESPLPLTPTAADVRSQHIGLLTAPPRISGDGPTAVPAGWMQLRQGADDRTICVGEGGRGLVASPAPLTMTLALPAAMATFRAESATVELQSERPWPNAGVTTELYNWQTGAWVEIDFDGPGTLALGNAAPFVQGGRLSLRFGGRIEEAGCVFAEAALRGELPATGGQP